MLELKNISYSAESEKGGEKEIIKELSLRVEDGKFLAITGPNGGGKSTTAKLIMGIEKPNSGSIIFDGKDITDMSITDRANLGIGFAFQQPVRFKGIRIIDLLRIAAKRNLTVAEACTYLSEVGLCAKDYIDREVNASLSGGEMKRIEIAGIAAKNSKLSVFDEPEERILSIADEIAVLSDGKILHYGKREDILPKIQGTPSAINPCRAIIG